MNAKRLNHLTAVRGIAASAVVLLHARHEWHVVFATGERYTNVIAAGGLWVHFFFILSGFVVMHAYGSWFDRSFDFRNALRFWWVRFGRIYPLYLLILLIWVACHRAGLIGVNDPEGSLAASFLLLQGFTFGDDVWNYPGWSISAEWFAYLAFPFIVRAMASVASRWVARLSTVLAAAIVLCFGLAPSIGAEPLMALVYCLVEFSLGCLVGRGVRTHTLKSRLGLNSSTIICLLPLVLIALPPTTITHWFNGLAAGTCALMIWVLATRETHLDSFFGSQAMQFLGTISYSIYLNHALLFRVSKSMANHVSGRPRFIETLPAPWALLAFVTYFAVLVLLSWITWILIEEPSRQLFKRMAAPRLVVPG